MKCSDGIASEESRPSKTGDMTGVKMIAIKRLIGEDLARSSSFPLPSRACCQTRRTHLTEEGGRRLRVLFSKRKVKDAWDPPGDKRRWEGEKIQFQTSFVSVIT